MSIGKIKEFDAVSGNWLSYCDRVKMYLTANGIKPELHLPTLISLVGDLTYELMVNLTSPKKVSEYTFEQVVKIVGDHLQPTPSIMAERYRFRKRRQQAGENVAQYVAELKRLSRYCGFESNLEDNLRDQLVCGITSDVIRQRLFAEQELTYVKAVTLATSLEAAEKDSALVEGSERQVQSQEGLNAMYSGAKNSQGSERCAACGAQGHLAKGCKFSTYRCSINLILTELTVSTKLLYAFVHRGLLMNIIDQLATGDFNRTTHRNVLENSIKSSRRNFWILLISCAIDALFHLVVGPALGKFRTLPVKMELIFFRADEPPSVYYVCVYQIIYKVPIVIIFIALHTIAWSLLSFTMTQLDLLIKDFKNIECLAKETMVKKKCSRDDAFHDVFERFVLRHRAIIKFVNSIESTFGGQFAITLLLCSTVTCFTGVQFLSIESPTKNLVGVLWIMAYLVIFVLVMYTDCFYGNSVYVKSTELATVAYGSPWLEMPQKLRKNLVLFIARAQKPLAITAYNLVTISLPTFTKVMKWTYNAFAIMNGTK